MKGVNFNFNSLENSSKYKKENKHFEIDEILNWII